MPGTRSYHQFIPISETLIGAKRISEQDDFTSIYEFAGGKTNYNENSGSTYLIGDYIACIYDLDWYIGRVESVCEEEGDMNIRFMHPKGSGWRYPKNIFWPARDDFCYIPQNHILCKISAPTPVTDRKYKVSPNDFKSIVRALPSYD